MVFLKPLSLFAQDDDTRHSIYSLGLWNLTSVAGDLKLGGQWTQGSTNSYGYDNYTRSSNLFAGFMLRTNSYLWSPKFLTIGIDGGYFPQTKRDEYLIFPNRSDVINTKNIHLNTVLFPSKIVSLTTYANYDNSYDSREGLTDIQTDTKTIGTSFAYRNKVIPFTMSYNQSDWVQKEINTDKTFIYDQNTFTTNASRDFGKRSHNEFIYSHKDYNRQDYNLSPVKNVTDNMELRDSYFLDSAQKIKLNSSILGIDQRGIDTFKQLRINENIFAYLPHDFTANGGYTFYYTYNPQQELRQHNVNINLGHQLYQSLYTGLTGGYDNSNQTSYTDAYSNLGVIINYNKKILKTGLLSLGYNYNWLHDKRESQDVLLPVMNEPYTLVDNQLVLIKNPFVQLASVILKDITGTLVYQENIDYLLIPRNNYLEIQRIPGGRIANNGTVYAYYTANQPGNSQYDINTTNYSIDVSLFRRLIGVYYRVMTIGYSNVSISDNSFLNYLTNTMYGIRTEYKIFSAGAEINEYQSSLYPYRLTRYFFTMQGNYRRRISYSLNANVRITDHLTNNESNRVNNDANAMLGYSLTQKTKLDFTAIYTYQHGQQINLDLYSGRVRLSTMFRDVTCLIAVEAYQRSYLDVQKYKYIGAYIQLIKKFKY